MSIRLCLDITRRDANVLFDRFTGARMSAKEPLCTVPFISENVRISIRNGKVIDVDKVTGIPVREVHEVVHDRLLVMLGITRNVEVEPPVGEPSTFNANEGADEVDETKSEEKVAENTEMDKAPTEEKQKKSSRSKSKKEEGEK